MKGPIGEFEIPEAPENTREHVRALSQQVFDGEYDHPDLPKDGVRRILDIGCGWGAFAVWAHTLWPDARIIGYDPHEAALSYFHRNAPFAAAFPIAVTAEARALYGVSWEWGSGHTRGRTDGREVTAFHPRFLAEADILKCDAEGVEIDVVGGYPFLRELKALIYEFHSPEDRTTLRAMCRHYGFRNIKESTEDYGVSIWLPN